jgi:hypothetical protein
MEGIADISPDAAARPDGDGTDAPPAPRRGIVASSAPSGHDRAQRVYPDIRAQMDGGDA